MAAVTAGHLLGFGLCSFIHFDKDRKFTVFVICGVIHALSEIVLPLWLNFPFMLTMGLVSGLTNAIFGTLLTSVIQLTTPQDMMGKVFSILDTFMGGFIPIAMAIGGVLAEFISIRVIISSCATIMLACFIGCLFVPAIKQFINSGPTVDSRL